MAESALLAVVLAALAVLWARRGPAAAPGSGESKRATQPQAAAPAARAAALAPAARADREGARALRAKGPSYGRAFELLYDNPGSNPLHLTAEQVDGLQDCYTRLYEDRLELEARLAKTEPVDGGGVFIEIPAYPDEGKALEQVFIASLGDRLGAPLAGAIVEQYLQMIEAGNEGLGQNAQQMLVTPDAENPGHLKVVHSAVSSDGSTSASKVSILAESDLTEYGPLAADFPKP